MHEISKHLDAETKSSPSYAFGLNLLHIWTLNGWRCRLPINTITTLRPRAGECDVDFVEGRSQGHAASGAVTKLLGGNPFRSKVVPIEAADAQCIKLEMEICSHEWFVGCETNHSGLVTCEQDGWRALMGSFGGAHEA